MQSRRSSLHWSGTLGVALFALLNAACGSSDQNGVGGSSAGSPGQSAGAGGVTASGLAGGAGVGGLIATGGNATGSAGAPSGGTGGGGAESGAAGSSAGGVASGGLGNGGAAGAAGAATGGTSAGGAAGTTNCAGRSLSLAANGTGTDSDAAYAQVVVDLMSALPIGNAKRTVEFWAYIKTSDWHGDTNEIFYYGASGKVTAFGLDFGTPAVGSTSNHATLNPTTDTGFNDDSGADLGINSNTNQWVHVAMTWDGTALRTYVNGTVRITTGASGSTTMLATAQGPLRIGCNPENKACFNGWFDEFRIWNIARTDAQIKDNYNKPLLGNEAGLIGYWKFDDAVGSMTAADSLTTGTTHSGMLTAAASNQLPTFGTPPAPLPLTCL
ncbi:MAG TPA: LamG domain-containing protein [Polyangiaceae bacterium]|nr:LamG domain-containing protein [Polyangiaceae bacterium]